MYQRAPKDVSFSAASRPAPVSLGITATSLSRATDVNVLHDLKETLDAEGIYEWQEVEDFVEHYFNDADAQELSPFHRYCSSQIQYRTGA